MYSFTQLFALDKILHITLIIGFSYTLTACQTIPTSTNTKLCNTDLPNKWQVNGRIKVVYDKKYAVNFSWLQTNDIFDINILGAFGSLITNINGTHQQARLTANNQIIITNKIAKSLHEITGLHLPITHIKNWMLAQAGKNTFTAQYNESGCFSTLKQNNYTIEYLHYINHDTYTLPRTIIAYNNQVQLHIKLNNWQF